jgi:hypothetical protein
LQRARVVRWELGKERSVRLEIWPAERPETS